MSRLSTTSGNDKNVDVRTPLIGLSGTTIRLKATGNYDLDDINKLLAAARNSAFKGDGGYKAASLIETEDGQLFLNVNVKIGAQHINTCAEFRAISDGEANQGEKLKVKSVWLMAGLNDKEGKIKNDAVGTRANPCGICLEVIKAFSFDDNTLIHSLPLNDGTWKLKGDSRTNKDERDDKYLQPHQVRTRTIGLMLPYTTEIAIKDGGAKPAKWWKSLEQAVEAMHHPILTKILAPTSVMDSEEELQFVNRALSESITNVYDPKKTSDAISVVVKTASGKYVNVASVHGDDVRSRARAEETAMFSIKEDDPIIDVWVMQARIDHPTSMKMPPGDIRERIKKFSKGGANIHLVPLNDGRENINPDEVVTKHISELLPYAYYSGKAREGSGNGNGGIVH